MTLVQAILIFAIGAAVIAVVGTRLTQLADRLADRTGLGEAFMGAVFLGAITSLPGITASVTAALEGHASLALANAIGGIAAQTAFLTVADIAYRKANLEHAAASVPNMMQAALLIILLSILIVALAVPAVPGLWFHPASLALFVVYVLGMRMVRWAHRQPMWRPRMTDETSPDEPDEPQSVAGEDVGMWTRFGLAAITVIIAGWAVTHSATVIAVEWGINFSIAGAVFTAVATSLPELVTSIAAVRRGALTLAVGGVLGGNCFDTLFAAAADFAYPSGSLYHAAFDASTRELLLIAMSILMTALLLLGLLRRQRAGPAGIGFESMAVLMLYLATLGLLTIT